MIWTERFKTFSEHFSVLRNGLERSDFQSDCTIIALSRQIVRGMLQCKIYYTTSIDPLANLYLTDKLLMELPHKKLSEHFIFLLPNFNEKLE